jgi:hypothetical protein
MARSQAFRESRDNDGAARTLHLYRKGNIMKLAILAATAALLAAPAFAQTSTVPGQGTSGQDQSAAQGRTGSSAGGYRTDQGSGPSTTGSTGTGAGSSGTMGGQSGTTMPMQQGQGTGSGNAPRQ